jgi:poly(glycerol-phosphate) alpha-glucosyltransferase
MHSICLLESVSRSDGGIFEAECALQRELHLGQGVQVDVVGMEDRFSSEDASRWLPLKPKAVKVKGPGAFGYSPDLLPVLNPKADLLYAATLWKYPSWAALQWAERTGKPMMVAPHGSLDAWALRNAAWKKRIAAALFKNRQLNKAACLRALCQSEADAFRAYGLTQPIAIIPNGVEIPEGDLKKPEAGNLKPETGGRKTLLFLGRIHPKKGLPNLIRALKKALDARRSTLDSPKWQLVIAGWDQGGHEAELIQLCEELGLKSAVTDAEQRPGQLKLKVEGERRALDARHSSLDSAVLFFGPAFDRDKEDLLRNVDAFILPSFSEGLPMSLLEGWSYGLPVVMTPECNLPEGFAADAAIRIETSVDSIAEGLGTLFSMNDADLMTMGAKGRGLVEERFTWKSVAAQMREVYDWMLGGGAAPSSVIMK